VLVPRTSVAAAAAAAVPVEHSNAAAALVRSHLLLNEAPLFHILNVSWTKGTTIVMGNDRFRDLSA